MPTTFATCFNYWINDQTPSPGSPLQALDEVARAQFARKNAGHPLKFQFQMKNKSLFKKNHVPNIAGNLFVLKIYICFLYEIQI